MKPIPTNPSPSVRKFFKTVSPQPKIFSVHMVSKVSTRAVFPNQKRLLVVLADMLLQLDPQGKKDQVVKRQVYHQQISRIAHNEVGKQVLIEPTKESGLPDWLFTWLDDPVNTHSPKEFVDILERLRRPFTDVKLRIDTFANVRSDGSTPRITHPPGITKKSNMLLNVATNRPSSPTRSPSPTNRAASPPTSTPARPPPPTETAKERSGSPPTPVASPSSPPDIPGGMGTSASLPRTPSPTSPWSPASFESTRLVQLEESLQKIRVDLEELTRIAKEARDRPPASPSGFPQPIGFLPIQPASPTFSPTFSPGCPTCGSPASPFARSHSMSPFEAAMRTMEPSSPSVASPAVPVAQPVYPNSHPSPLVVLQPVPDRPGQFQLVSLPSEISLAPPSPQPAHPVHSFRHHHHHHQPQQQHQASPPRRDSDRVDAMLGALQEIQRVESQDGFYTPKSTFSSDAPPAFEYMKQTKQENTRMDKILALARSGYDVTGLL